MCFFNDYSLSLLQTTVRQSSNAQECIEAYGGVLLLGMDFSLVKLSKVQPREGVNWVNLRVKPEHILIPWYYLKRKKERKKERVNK